MSIVKKTKEERQEANRKVIADAKKSRDTPLSDSPDVVAPITDIKSALADINTRAAARQKSVDESNSKLEDARIARSKAKRSIAGEGGRLFGLASFQSTTGRTRET
jgi:chromosome segregation ATPase